MCDFLNLVDNDEVSAEAVNGEWVVTRLVKGDIKKDHKGKEIVVKGDVAEPVGKFKDAEFRMQFVPIGDDAIKALQDFAPVKSAPKKKASKK
jgi:hypothetical protein